MNLGVLKNSTAYEIKKVLDKEEKVGIIERVEKLKVRWSRG